VPLFMAAEDTATATAKRGRIGGLRRCVPLGSEPTRGRGDLGRGMR
jgi:hypothetical protein